ncbi:MAG: [FeFe] hydrogenase H-cluster radical SAM maturase HydE [Spirochaetaceae bacterium]|jgi:biotin synthase|nr:[FeFe] hydrogenase H-cluster radical SAM maturase HydE [Spirochaetaceae bacterium]
MIKPPFTDDVLLHYISASAADESADLFAAAREVQEKYYGKRVYFRALIEFTNYCENDCYYCGIRKSNGKLKRYRLCMDDILECCREGAALGYKTFVLQGGEDPYFNDERMIEIITAIRRAYPDHAITLSIGERGRASYEAFFAAGANRYLLRHETACDDHYRKLHPPRMSLTERKQCLYDLKNAGYQVGAGFMTGSPFQKPEHLLADLRFLEELQPQMVGIGPFIPQADTPFGGFPAGDLELSLRMIALTRLLLPDALIPATTALGTVSPQGRERGLAAGANVVMPNLSPKSTRRLYALYDNKICIEDAAAECRFCMENRVRSFGFEADMSRGS